MTDGCVEYDETNDLYMQILWEARKVEDKRLAKMILRRMHARRRSILPEERETADIVPFPLTPALCNGPTEPESPFWKQQQFWQDLIPFCAILSFFIGWFIFFTYLLAQNHPIV